MKEETDGLRLDADDVSKSNVIVFGFVGDAGRTIVAMLLKTSDGMGGK